MGKINVLDKSIYNMIAAGEVVERPASVVKELIENSIDAQSTHITVEIKNGGMTYIRIADNGVGMDKEDLRKAILPHATSKIKDREDLDKIYTLGFRGEALASICAVSRVEIYSKQKDADIGNMIAVEGGVITEENEAGCADGTTIIVRNLFFNTPARMKFLKKDSTEAAYVTDVVNKAVLGNTSLSFKYIQNGKGVLSSKGDSDIKNAIYSVYGKDYMKHLLEVSYEDENVSVSGCIGDTFLSKPNRTYQSFFINSRNISSKIMSAAIGEAYKNSLMTGKFPFCVLSVKINAHLVDVNVHPTKMEVRFSDDRKIFDAVYWACKNALQKEKHIPEMTTQKKTFPINFDPKEIEQKKISFLKDSFVKDESHYKKDVPHTKVNLRPETKPEIPKDKKSEPVTQPSGEDSFGFVRTVTGFVKKNPQEESSQLRENTDSIIDNYIKNSNSIKESETESAKAHSFDFSQEKSKEIKTPSVTDKKPELNTTEKISPAPNKEAYEEIADYKIIGQIFDTYIIVQKGDEMHLIDQHAAHERLYFEEFLKDYKEGNVQSQLLMMPYTFEFSSGDYSKINENIEFFKSAGFDIEPFGINTVIVRQIPVDAGDISIRDLVLEMAEKLDKGKTLTPSEREYDALHTMACKRALKGNHALSIKEMEHLVERLKTLDTINTCPHGRPIEIKMSKYQLEKQFKRIV